MIDFRYHLVSLISVFLALAVGIVLGAGPLRGPIASSLQSQVDSLREDRDGLRTELEHANNDTAQLSAFVESSATPLLDGALSNTDVAVVRFSDADSAQADSVVETLGTAGGTVVADVSLSESAVEPADENLLAELREADPTLPDDEAEATRAALVRALAPSADSNTGDSETGGADSSESGTEAETEVGVSSVSESTATALFDALAGSGRIATGERPESDVLVVVAPADPTEASADDPSALDAEEGADGAETDAAAADETDAAEDEAPAEVTPEDYTAEAEFVRVLSDTTEVVTAGSRASAVQGLLAGLRSDGDGLTTVDSLDLATGAVIVPLAVASVDGGQAGHYGLTQSADSVLPETS